MKIAIIDSGKGGLALLERLSKEVPYHNYILFYDNKNFPYGTKSIEKLNEVIIPIIEMINYLKCDLIIIACNTLSTTLLENIKTYTKIEIIDIASINNQLLSTTKGSTLLLGSKATINSKYYQKENLLTLVATDLINAIEKENDHYTYTYLRQIKKNYQVDNILLGCTHFSLIIRQIEDIMGGVNILDGYNILINKIKLYDPDEGLSVSIYISEYDKHLIETIEGDYNNILIKVIGNKNGK